MKIVELKQRSTDWIEWRNQGLGSTDIASIMGECSYRSALDVFKEKLGMGKDVTVSKAMQRGMSFEDEARQWFENNLNRGLFLPVCFQHDGYSFFHSSSDGYNAVDNTIVEIKIPCVTNYTDRSIDEEIEIYKFQLQWHMIVSGFTNIFYCRYSPENQSGEYKIVNYDPVLGEQIIQKAILFWNNLQNGIPPDSGKKDYMIIEDDSAKIWCRKYIELSKQKKSIEKELTDLKKVILDFGDDGNFKMHGLTCSRMGPKSSYDYEAMAKDGIDINKYKKLSDSIGFYTIKIDSEK